MGTEIILEIGKMTLDWSKNMMGVNHGVLYLETDRQHCSSCSNELNEEIEDDKDQGSDDICFRKQLRSLVPRLELLGHSIEHLRKQYESHALEWLAYLSEDEDESPLPTLFSFEEIIDFICSHPILSLDDTYSFDDPSQKQSFVHRFPKELTIRIPYSNHYDFKAGYSERSHFCSLMGFFSPYNLLRGLAECPENLDLEVMWEYGPLVRSGWAKESQFNPGLSRTQTFLIATEGSSDVHILKHALMILRPDIADFFHFIDVTESHPFPGTGNLVKFSDGLVKINVQNNILLLFDNDAEGYEAYQKTMSLRLPSNMRAMVLPDIEDFKTFSTKGPEGITVADINGRAAAIECYLDLNLHDYPPPQIVWTNYKKDMDRYQGVLQHKESYSKKFLKMNQTNIVDESYETKKILQVLDAVIFNATEIAQSNMRLLASRY